MLLVCGLVSPAQASTDPVVAYSSDSGKSPNQVVMSIPVTASVGGTCGFAAPSGAPNGTVNAGAIDTTAWTGDVPFTVECTAPWRIAVSSLKGALENSGTAATGYLNRAPYTVSLHVASDGGDVDSSCTVDTIDQALPSSSCNFKGAATTSNGLLIPRSFDLSGSYIRAAAPAYSGASVLIAGAYSDTLTVTVSPAS